MKNLSLLGWVMLTTVLVVGAGRSRYGPTQWLTTPGGLVTNKTLKASDDVMYVVKTVIKTISIDDDASIDDFQFDDDAANTTEQPVDLGSLLPGGASVLSAQLRCIETVAGSGSAVMAVDLGTASGGAQLLTTQDLDESGDVRSSIAGTAPEVPIATPSTGKNVWINATPDANWNTLTTGRWAVLVTYIDYNAVIDAKN